MKGGIAMTYSREHTGPFHPSRTRSHQEPKIKNQMTRPDKAAPSKHFLCKDGFIGSEQNTVKYNFCYGRFCSGKLAEPSGNEV